MKALFSTIILAGLFASPAAFAFCESSDDCHNFCCDTVTHMCQSYVCFETQDKPMGLLPLDRLLTVGAQDEARACTAPQTKAD